jgi:hypothetical protein
MLLQQEHSESHLRKDTSLEPHIFAEFTHHIAGEVVVPGSQADEKLWNVFNQTGSPAVIVCGQSTEDIVLALRFAREQHLGYKCVAEATA